VRRNEKYKMLNGVLKKWKGMPVELKASTAYTLCSILQRSLSFITLPLFTRLLTKGQYGQATVYSSWYSFLIIILTLQLPYGSFSKAMVKYRDRRDEYIASAEGICLFLMGGFLVIYFPFRRYFNAIFELPTFIMIIMAFEILCNTSIAFWRGKKRFEFRYKEVISVTLINSVLSVVMQIILVLSIADKGYAKIVGSAAVSIAIGGSFLIRSFVKGGSLYNKELWRYALGFNVPLLVYYISQMIFNTSDRIMISHLAGGDKAAVYGVAYNLALMLNFILTAINNSYIPWLYRKIEKGQQRNNRKIANYIAILISLMLLGIIWFSPEIIWVMAGEEYMDAIWIVPPIAVSVLLLFYAQLSINMEFYFEEKKKLVYASVGAALINVVLNYIFIPIWGYYVAGYTTLISYVVFAGANYFTAKKITKKEGISDDWINLGALLVILLLLMSIGLVGMLLYEHFIVRIVIAAVVFSVIVFNYKKIGDIIGILKSK